MKNLRILLEMNGNDYYTRQIQQPGERKMKKPFEQLKQRLTRLNLEKARIDVEIEAMEAILENLRTVAACQPEREGTLDENGQKKQNPGCPYCPRF